MNLIKIVSCQQMNNFTPKWARPKTLTALALPILLPSHLNKVSELSNVEYVMGSVKRLPEQRTPTPASTGDKDNVSQEASPFD